MDKNQKQNTPPQIFKTFPKGQYHPSEKLLAKFSPPLEFRLLNKDKNYCYPELYKNTSEDFLSHSSGVHIPSFLTSIKMRQTKQAHSCSPETEDGHPWNTHTHTHVYLPFFSLGHSGYLINWLKYKLPGIITHTPELLIILMSTFAADHLIATEICFLKSLKVINK